MLRLLWQLLKSRATLTSFSSFIVPSNHVAFAWRQSVYTLTLDCNPGSSCTQSFWNQLLFFPRNGMVSIMMLVRKGVGPFSILDLHAWFQVFAQPICCDNDDLISYSVIKEKNPSSECGSRRIRKATRSAICYQKRVANQTTKRDLKKKKSMDRHNEIPKKKGDAPVWTIRGID